MGKWSTQWVVCAWIAAALVGCDDDATADAHRSGQATANESAPGAAHADQKDDAAEKEGLLIGVYPLAPDPVIDGDTIRVKGFEKSVRLLGLDTEERFHGNRQRAAATGDFDRYLEAKRGNADRPPKTGTPMGEEAAEFARRFFDGVELVRLERDDPKELRGHFGRLLAYAMVKKDGRWTSYNEECIRAGMSPYFTKYGYSRRFHKALSDAEAEARKANRGIWNPSAQSYRDYDERKAWWNARADFIRAFEHEANRRDDFLLLSHWDAGQRLEENLGKDVTVLSTIERIKHFEGLVRVSLAMTAEQYLPIIFFDKDVFRKSELANFNREPVRVRGRVERYTKGRYTTLQIVVDDPAQVTTPELPGRR